MLEYAVLPKIVPFKGQGLHFVGGKELGWVPCVALERSARTAEILAIFCSASWGVVSLSGFPTIAKAKAGVERYFPGTRALWRKHGATVEQVKRYLARKWAPHACSFCGRTPLEVSPIFGGAPAGRREARICAECVKSLYQEAAQPRPS